MCFRFIENNIINVLQFVFHRITDFEGSLFLGWCPQQGREAVSSQLDGCFDSLLPGLYFPSSERKHCLSTLWVILIFRSNSSPVTATTASWSRSRRQLWPTSSSSVTPIPLAPMVWPSTFSIRMLYVLPCCFGNCLKYLYILGGQHLLQQRVQWDDQHCGAWRGTRRRNFLLVYHPRSSRRARHLRSLSIAPIVWRKFKLWCLRFCNCNVFSCRKSTSLLALDRRWRLAPRTTMMSTLIGFPLKPWSVWVSYCSIKLWE